MNSSNRRRYFKLEQKCLLKIAQGRNERGLVLDTGHMRAIFVPGGSAKAPVVRQLVAHTRSRGLNLARDCDENVHVFIKKQE